MQSVNRHSLHAVAAIRSEINVTPLIDVCLVLLIVFMVVAPLLRGIEVSLPRTAAPQPIPGSDHQLTLFQRRDGSVFVGSTAVATERLVAVLKAAHDDDPTRLVVLDGDERVLYGRMAILLNAVRQAGFSKMGLATLTQRN